MSDELKQAVLAYLSEFDNPVPDFSYRRLLRNRLRKLSGAPPEQAVSLTNRLPEKSKSLKDNG